MYLTACGKILTHGKKPNYFGIDLHFMNAFLRLDFVFGIVHFAVLITYKCITYLNKKEPAQVWACYITARQ